jgi:cell division septation protein DedD
VIDRLNSLARAFEIRAISASEQAAERTVILEGLLPVQPRIKTSLILPPKGLMEGAALVGRLERLRGMGLISAEEQSREREALEKILAALDPPPRPSVSAMDDSSSSPQRLSGSTQRSSGSTASGSKGAKGAKGAKGGSGKSGVHLASFKSREQADKDWGSLKRAHPELAKLSMTAVKSDVKGKGTYWRLIAGPLSSRKAAEDLCRTLKSRRQYCDPASF